MGELRQCTQTADGHSHERCGAGSAPHRRRGCARYGDIRSDRRQCREPELLVRFPSESVLHASDEHLLAGPAVERQHRDVHERLRGSPPGFLFFEVGLRRDLRRCACGHSECDADRLCDLLLSALRRKGPRAGDVRFGKLVPACRGRSAGLDDGRHGRKPL